MLTLTFGKFKGRSIREVPFDYVTWLANPVMKGGALYPVPDDIAQEAKRLVSEKAAEKALNDQGSNLLIGLPSDDGRTHFVIEDASAGDVIAICGTLDKALEILDRQYRNDDGTRDAPDPEDAQILIWEVLPTGHKKVVWHFSGWHYSTYAAVPQGCLPGDTESLYDIAMLQYAE